MGMRNAQAHFQIAIEQTLAGLLWVIVGAYVDDASAGSKTFQGHLLHLQTIFNRLRRDNWKLRLPKCKFLPKELLSLGLILTDGGVKTDDAKIAIIRDARVPRNRKELQSFLGLTNYFRKFIKDYSKIVLPLTELTKKDKPYIWNEPHNSTFEELKTTTNFRPCVG